MAANHWSAAALALLALVAGADATLRSIEGGSGATIPALLAPTDYGTGLFLPCSSGA